MTQFLARATRTTDLYVSARQRSVLALLDILGGRVGRLDFQKLLLLYCHEPDVEALYEFVPYKFGAFSFTSYADRRKLVERGFLKDEENQWELTEEGRQAAAPARDFWLTSFVERHRHLRGDALVAETYRRFPYFAIRSEIAERVLQGDEAALRRIDDARPTAQDSALFTIGYEGRSLEAYLNLLLRSAVTVLCDVRRNPISRKYGFSKNTLKKGCEGVGIRYEHLPELGIASDERRGLETQADYDALFAAYERNCLPKQNVAVATIANWISGGERVALTCYERLPAQCHRQRVAAAVESAPTLGIAARHL